jgi:PIN domain nuclease of toxin-antitoxin system
VLLVDTHVVIWIDGQIARLGRQARQEIERVWADGGLSVSAASFWEAAMLVRKRKLELAEPPRAWRAVLLETGMLEIPLDGDTAALSQELEDFHGDPADRFIVATALAHGLTLMTADQRILDWPGPLERIDARR